MISHTSSEKNLLSLYGLRAIFCAVIVLYHVHNLFGSVFSDFAGVLSKYGGYFGNYIFFMLSGFMIAYFYKKKLMERKYSFREFIGKRIRKIYPMYFFSNLVIMLICKNEITVKKTITTFFMMANGWFDGINMPYNIPSWFLCILLLCYTLYFVIVRISSFCPLLYLPLCVFFVVWGMLLEKLNLNLLFSYQTCGEGYMNFFIGTLLAELIINKFVNSQKLLAAGGFILFCVTGFLVVFRVENVIIDTRWIISIICVAIICLTLFGNLLKLFLSSFPIRCIGYCSFSIYLWHIPAINLLLLLERKFGIVISDERLRFIIYLIFLAVVSAVSYYIFEKNNFKRSNKDIFDEVTITKSKV